MGQLFVFTHLVMLDDLLYCSAALTGSLWLDTDYLADTHLASLVDDRRDMPSGQRWLPRLHA